MSIKDLIAKLNIDETFTKNVKKPKKFSKVKDNIPLKKGLNYMGDLLMLPHTKAGYKYLFVVLDLATDNFDIEPMKTKEPKEVLDSFKKMFKRAYIKEPKATLATDAGTEFKGVFHKWLYDESIYHKVAEPGRHQQMANVENLNRTLGRIFNGYMNMKEEKSGKVYKEWDDIIDTVRKDLNAIRKKPEQDPYTYKYPIPEMTKAKYKVGDMVIRQSDVPLSALGHKQPTANFREGDYRFYANEPRKIIKVLSYSGSVPTRYILQNIPHISYTEAQLRPSKAEEELYTVKKIIGSKIEKKKKYLLIWWTGYKKAEATYEPYDVIKKDVPELVEEYEESL